MIHSILQENQISIWCITVNKTANNKYFTVFFDSVKNDAYNTFAR